MCGCARWARTHTRTKFRIGMEMCLRTWNRMHWNNNKLSGCACVCAHQYWDPIIDCAAFDGVAYRFYVCYSHSSFASIFFSSCIFVLFGWMYINFSFEKEKEERKFVSIDRQYCRFSNETENEKTFIEILIVFVVQFLFCSVRSILCCSISMAVCIHRYHAVEIKFIVVVLLLRDSDKRKVNRLRDLLTPCATLHFKRTLTVFPGRNVNKFPIFWLLFLFSASRSFCFCFRLPVAHRFSLAMCIREYSHWTTHDDGLVYLCMCACI